MSSSDIFGQLAAQDQARQQHDQAASSQNQGDIFSQIAANGGTVPQEQAPDTSGQITNDIGKTVIVPKDGESFADTMDRAIAQGKKTTQQDINDELKTAPKKVAETLVAAPAMGAAGAAAIAGTGEAGAMAGRLTQAALQPIKDAIVEELPYLKSSPGLYVEHIAKQALTWAMENPDKVLKMAAGSGVLAAAAKVLMSRSGI